MRLPVWLHNLLHRGEVPRATVNPYTEDAINPRQFMWNLYRENISLTFDAREYRPEAEAYVREQGELVEQHIKVVHVQKSHRTDLVARLFEERQPGTFYLYRDNLIRVNIVCLDSVELCFYYPTSKPCVIDEFKNWVVEQVGESKVSILVMEFGDLTANSVAFKAPIITDLELNYGTGFKMVHDKIVGKLNERRASLLLLHGAPGSGKSYYIKYLTSLIDREFIFIPVNMTDQLASPSFISFLMSKKEAVLILEDAEQVVQEREGNSNSSAVATLLNISDGILGSLLNITIIVTYNADRQFIDKALLRKGRLSFDYDFGPLKTADAARLMTHLGKDAALVKGPMTLADIYGVEDDTGQQPEAPRAMGFGALLSSQNPKRGD